MAEAEVSSRESRWSLKGMTALVTGGTRGIGLMMLAFSFSFFLQIFFLPRAYTNALLNRDLNVLLLLLSVSCTGLQ
jgi:hypothetical protein